jgi:hypothetical protein
MQWDPSFVDRSPGLSALAEAAQPLRRCANWPSLRQLQLLCDSRAIVNACGMPLRLVGETNGEPYEIRLHLRGEMHVRERSWHDLFNVLAWMAYPRTKAALNARHYAEATRCDPASLPEGRRTSVRDALTLFDESGAIVAAADPELLELIRTFEWKQLFWTHRERVEAHLRVFVLGHALAGKLLSPYVGLTAHAVLLAASESFTASALSLQLEELDGAAAECVGTGPTFDAPRMLAPLPVLGVPGWSRESASEAFYDDAGYFRPGRRVRPPP